MAQVRVRERCDYGDATLLALNMEEMGSGPRHSGGFYKVKFQGKKANRIPPPKKENSPSTTLI